VWCDGGGRHWWVLTWCPKINDKQRIPFIVSFRFHTQVVVVVCGHVISIHGQLFSYVGSCCVVVVVAVCHGQSQYFIATSLSAMWHLASLSAKKVGGGVCVHTCWWSLRLVTWPLDVVGEGVVLGTRRRWCCWWVVCCCPAVVVAWSSSVVVVVVVSHHCRQSWLLMWCSCIVWMVYRHVQVVVGGGQWCGNDGWASWVGIVDGGRWWWWWWWLRKKEVVVC